MKKLAVIGILFLLVFLLTVTVGCQQKTTDIIQNITIFKWKFGDFVPPGGWTFSTTGPHPTEVQELFDPGDKMNLGLVINRQIKDDITFSRFTFYNRQTGAKQEVVAALKDYGPYDPDGEYFLGYKNPWEVPGKDGEYELRLYMGDELVASALFNVGIWPVSWGPEMIKRPAPIYEVRVLTDQAPPWLDVAVYIKGGLPQGCEASYGWSVEQVIDDTIYIEATIRHLKDLPCEDYVFFEETFNLRPSLLNNFTPGETYKVDVNGYITTFVMPQTD